MFYLFFFPPSLNHGSFYIEFSSLCVRYQRILSNVLPYLKILLRFSQVCLSILPISFFLALWDFFFVPLYSFQMLYLSRKIWHWKSLYRSFLHNPVFSKCVHVWRLREILKKGEENKPLWTDKMKSGTGRLLFKLYLKKSNISLPRKIQCYSESLWIMKIFIILKHILQKKMVENQ